MVQIVNDGQNVVTINSILVTGEAAADFTVINDTCGGQSLAAQQRCTVQVRFSPHGVGQRKASLDVTYTGDVQQTLSAPLVGQTPTLYLPAIAR